MDTRLDAGCRGRVFHKKKEKRLKVESPFGAVGGLGDHVPVLREPGARVHALRLQLLAPSSVNKKSKDLANTTVKSPDDMRGLNKTMVSSE